MLMMEDPNGKLLLMTIRQKRIQLSPNQNFLTRGTFTINDAHLSNENVLPKIHPSHTISITKNLNERTNIQ